MQKYFMLILFCCFFERLCAQKTLKVEYALIPLNENSSEQMEVNGFSFSYPARMNLRMVQNDSLSYIHFYNSQLDPLKSEKRRLTVK